jgi:hypothetical protein
MPSQTPATAGTYRFFATDEGKLYTAAPTTATATSLVESTTIKYWYAEDEGKLYSFDYLAPTVASSTGLVLDTTKDANEADATAFDLDGLLRNNFEITKNTVPGTYVVKLTVDNISEEITIVVNDPTPKVFIQSGLNSAGTAVTPSRVNPFSTEGAKFEQLFVDVGGSLGRSDFYVPLVKDEYEIEKYSDLTKFTAQIKVADLAVVTAGYPYAIKKVYPDGRVVEFADVVKVTSIDENQIATFDSGNTQFINNWIIDESTPVLGAYKFTFTINGITRNYTVNVVEIPGVKVNKLTVGSTQAILFNAKYRLPNTAVSAQDVVIEVTNNKIAASLIVEVTVTGTDNTTAKVLPNLALVGTTGKIALGKITLGTTDTHTVTFVVKFFKNTGTATSPVKGDQVGENLSINITQNA